MADLITSEGFAVIEPVATAAAAGLARSASAVASKGIATLLSRRFQRFWVARSVSKRAKNSRISVGWLGLARWLSADDVRQAVESGVPEALHGCVERLELRALSSEVSLQSARTQVVGLVRDESLRRMQSGDANVNVVRRIETAIEKNAEESRAVLTSRSDDVAFQNALGKIHPWRAAAAMQLDSHWPKIRDIVSILAAERNPGQIVAQWAANPPGLLETATPPIWSWLGCLASDYGKKRAALSLISRGIDAGADQSYWWARAGWFFGLADDENAELARGLWARSEPKHPLAAAGEAMLSEQYGVASEVLNIWEPEGPEEECIARALRSALAVARGDLNDAITIGIATAQEFPEASGNLVRTAEMLLSRGHHGNSIHRLDDFSRAHDLAIMARDSRRVWRGDSVEAILTAVKASALATNSDQAWNLTQPEPEGVALSFESRDKRLQREAATLAGMMGRFALANSIADNLDDAFTSHLVRGWESWSLGDEAAAESEWLRAWQNSDNDISRLICANELASHGLQLPDLSEIGAEHHVTVNRLRMVHEVLNGNGDLGLLRARAAESKELTLTLSERLSSDGQLAEAAVVLEQGGTRWGHPAMLKMAAAKYLSAGEPSRAQEVAVAALSLGGAGWAGRLETLSIEFDALEAQAKFPLSLAVIREMSTLSPADPTIRWILVRCLVRSGELKDAWQILWHDGTPIKPRIAAEARIWMGLAAEYDDSPDFVSRSLQVMRDWIDEPDVAGTFLVQIYRGLMRHVREVAEPDIRALHAAAEDFNTTHPNNTIFRQVSIDKDDPLASIREILKACGEPNEQVESLRGRVNAGELPLGLVADLTGRSYVEVCIKTGAGLVYSHSPEMANLGASGVEKASGTGEAVVIDASAAVTLSLLESMVSEQLVGAFVALETTDFAYRDALGAQQSLSLLSTVTMTWNSDEDRPAVVEISEREAKTLADRASRTVKLLSRSRRRGWPGLKRFSDLSSSPMWLSAVDLAVCERRSFWCDDRVLRQIAAAEGIATFGTFDVVNFLRKRGILSSELTSAITGTLLAAYHVDFGFSQEAFRFAAEMDGWVPAGAAVALSRRSSWEDPIACMRFGTEALSRAASKSPSDLEGWATAVALGLVRIAEDDRLGSSANLRVLLEHLFSQDWMRPDTLPFILKGIRSALVEAPGVDDPLRSVLTKINSQIALSHGAPAAAEFLLMFVSNLAENDKQIAANVILSASGPSR